MEHIERNTELLGKRMMRIMRMSMDFGREIINQEVDVGLLNVIVKPIVKTFYNYWSNTEIYKGTVKQIRAVVDSAKDLIKKDNLEESFEKTIEKYFPIFFDGDSTSKRCKEDHRNFRKLKEILYENFIDKVRETILFLKVKKADVESYEDLTKDPFSY